MFSNRPFCGCCNQLPPAPATCQDVCNVFQACNVQDQPHFVNFHTHRNTDLIRRHVTIPRFTFSEGGQVFDQFATPSAGFPMGMNQPSNMPMGEPFVGGMNQPSGMPMSQPFVGGINQPSNMPMGQPFAEGMSHPFATETAQWPGQWPTTGMPGGHAMSGHSHHHHHPHHAHIHCMCKAKQTF